MNEPLRDRHLRFDDFELDTGNARLSRGGVVVELPPKSYDVLQYLARRPGALVLKDELLDAVWGRRVVSEGAVKTVVSELRAALGDDARAPRWIETVQRRGYRFAGRVEGGDGLAAAGAAAHPAAAAPPPGNLPTALTPLIGRDAAIVALTQRLPTERLLTLTGPGGVGKTRLALDLAARAGRLQLAPDGVWLIELAPLPATATDAAALRSTLARAMLAAPAGTDSDAALVRLLHGQRLLLLLDNAEHLLDALAPWLATLLPQLPQLRVLLTSREPLQLPGESVWRVEPLALSAADDSADDDSDAAAAGPSAAEQLFIERVASRLNGFAPAAEQRRAVARICRALDGLPLALELAAARVPVLGVHGLAGHLSSDDSGSARLQLLTQGARNAPPKQRTLRAALDWSHALLTPAEQRMFRRLAVFRGGFDAEAAWIVCADHAEDRWALLDRVAALQDKSVLAESPPLSDDRRFTLLESLREYATERLQAAAEAEAMARRHLAWVRALFERADDRALDEPGLPWTARMAGELENLRAALRWGQAASAAAADDGAIAADWTGAVAASAKLWQRAGLAAEGARWCLAALAMSRAKAMASHPLDLAIATLARFTPMLTPREHLEAAERAILAYAASGDALREYQAHYYAWALALEIGEQIDRGRYIAGMQALVRPDWSPLRLRFLRSAVAQEDRLQGRTEAFLESCRADLATFRNLGAQFEAWNAGHLLMLAEHDAGRVDRALAVGRSVLDDERAAGRLRMHAQLLCMHTAMRAAAGDVRGTRAALAEALPMRSASTAGELLHLAMAHMAAHEGRDEDAARLLGWFESPARGGGAYGPRTFTRRACDSLGAQLATRLGGPALAALRAEASTLGDEAAVALGLRHASDERRHTPR